MTRFSRKAQAWSVDLVIGLLVFMLIMVIFYSLIGGEKESKVKDYSSKADYIAEKLYDKGLVDSKTGEFDENVFIELGDEDYQALKEELGIAGDFCVFIESNDNPPVIKVIVNEDNDGLTSLGSPDFNVSGFYCGEKWFPTPP